MVNTIVDVHDRVPQAGPPAGEPYLVVSTDSHAGPSLEHQLREYCPQRYLREFDAYAADVRERASRPGPKGISINMFSEEHIDRVRACRGLQDPHARLADMDADGVAADIVFAGGQNDEALPFVGGGFDAGHEDLPEELRLVGNRIWNRWLAEFVSIAPARLIGVMQIPIWNVAKAIEELEWAASAGLRAVNLPAPRRDFATYNDPVYEPFWQACADLDLPLVTHSAGGERPLGITGPGANPILFQAECHFFSRRSLWQMIFANVFERYPTLRLVFTEQRVAWVPDTLRDLDSMHLAENPHPKPARLPSEYWSRNCFLAGSFLAPYEVALRHEVGLCNLMWGSDYPHVEGTWPRTRLAMRFTFADVPEQEVRMILGENATPVFGLDRSALIEIARRVGPTPDELSVAPKQEEMPEHRGMAFRIHGGFS